jgi:Uma2 family endonuclease
VPDWVVDLESFRRWADDDAFPEKGRISYLRGAVWVDLSMEQVYSHTEVKAEINTVLRTMVNARRWGRYLPDGAYLSNVAANISNQPDGMFISNESARAGRLRSIEGRVTGYVELEGSPDMVLEVVSRSSVAKDNVVLKEAYFLAGIREYWLVDARKSPVKFDILRPGKSGFVAVRKRGMWTPSDVFAASFQLLQYTGEDGHPAFTLEVRADGTS